MSLRHALLALLEAGPMTGYELAKQFDLSVAYVWHAPHSQIYLELRKLERESLVVADVLPRGPQARATKRAYTLTEAGVAELLSWVALVQPPPRVRDPAYLKATYYEYTSPDTARHQFAEHRAHYQEQERQWLRHVELLEARATALVQRRLSHAPPQQHEAIVAFKVHVYQGLIDRARVEVAWAERGLALVDRLARAGTNTEPSPSTEPGAATSPTAGPTSTPR